MTKFRLCVAMFSVGVSGASMVEISRATNTYQNSLNTGTSVPYIQKSQLAESLAIWPVTSKLATFILATWIFCHYSIYES